MPAYRIYWLDEDNHITAADCLIADTDEIVRTGAGAHLGPLRPSRSGRARASSSE